MGSNNLINASSPSTPPIPLLPSPSPRPFHLILLWHQFRPSFRRAKVDFSKPSTKQKCVQRFLLVQSYWTCRHKKNDFAVQRQGRLQQIRQLRITVRNVFATVTVRQRHGHIAQRRQRLVDEFCFRQTVARHCNMLNKSIPSNSIKHKQKPQRISHISAQTDQQQKQHTGLGTTATHQSC